MWTQIWRYIYVKIKRFQHVDTDSAAFADIISKGGHLMNPKKKPSYTDEQVKILSQNPYTHVAMPNKVTFTLEFKEFFVNQVKHHGLSTTKILKAAGYDPSLFTRAAIDNIRRRILAEASSPEGLKPPRGLSQAERTEAFAKKNLDAQRTSTSIKEMQQRIVHLEQQVEFLKKIQNIYLHPPEN